MQVVIIQSDYIHSPYDKGGFKPFSHTMTRYSEIYFPKSLCKRIPRQLARYPLKHKNNIRHRLTHAFRLW